MAHENAAVTFKEFGLQDANTLEATQTMLESRVHRAIPLMDQEGPLPPHAQGGARIGWTTTRSSNMRRYDADGRGPVAAEFADLEPFAASGACRPSVSATPTAGRTMDEMQAFYDAVMPRADAAMTYLDQFPSRTCPRTG